MNPKAAAKVSPQPLRCSSTHLDQHTPAETRLHQRLGHPAGSVGSRTVYLCVIFPGEGSAPMGAPAPVGVHDDLTPSQTSITLWAQHENTEARTLSLNRLLVVGCSVGHPIQNRPASCPDSELNMERF